MLQVDTDESPAGRLRNAFQIGLFVQICFLSDSGILNVGGHTIWPFKSN